MRTSSSPLLAILLLTACGDPAAPVDAGNTLVDGARVDAGSTEADTGVDAHVGETTWTTESRTLVSSGDARTYELVTTTYGASAAPPLVIAFHGDGGSGAGFHAGLNLEEASLATDRPVVAYVDAMGGTFEYWSDAGRAREVALVTDLVAALAAELPIDTSRIFLVGFSGGATLINALGCRLGADMVRGLGIHSGTLYPSDPPDFEYTASGGVSCTLPDTIFLWGEEDATDVGFMQGEAVRDNYIATAECDATTMPLPMSPECAQSDGCTHSVVWCPYPGVGHALAPNAARTIMRFFASER